MNKVTRLKIADEMAEKSNIDIIKRDDRRVFTVYGEDWAETLTSAWEAVVDQDPELASEIMNLLGDLNG